MKMTSSVVITLLSATVCFFTGCGESAPEPVTDACAIIVGKYCHGEVVLSEETAGVRESLEFNLEMYRKREMYRRREGDDEARKDWLGIQIAETVSPASSAQELKVETLMATLGEFIEYGKDLDVSRKRSTSTDHLLGETTKTETTILTAKETFGEITISSTQKLTTVTTEQKSGKDSEVKHFEAKWSLLLGEKEILTVFRADEGPSITFDKKVFSDGLTAEAVMTLLSKNGVQVKPLCEALAIQKLTPSMRRKVESVNGEINGTLLSRFFFPSLRGEGGPCIEYGAVYIIKQSKEPMK